ncbi:MAG: type II toxin-antitoxin system PemK/MazF family toxin [Chitinophagales bacterium]
MEKFVTGDIVVLPFPFSDLSDSKRRPAFVVRDLSGNDIILCQITSRERDTRLSISLKQSDFESGSLPHDSFIKPYRIFTADKKIIIRKAGKVNSLKSVEVINTIVSIVMGN